LSETFNLLLDGSVVLDVRIVSDTSSSVSEELLVDSSQRSVLLSEWLLDAVSVVLVVLILG